MLSHDWDDKQEATIISALADLDDVDEAIVAGDWLDARATLDSALHKASYVVSNSPHIGALVEFFRVTANVRIRILHKAQLR